jgi:imidazoleglycerol-phosphate dehydratase
MSVFVEKKRKAKVSRETTETNIELGLELDGKGSYKIDVGISFFEHMLTLLSKHSKIDLKVKAQGDLGHHLIEDIGIVMGQALKKALGKKKGIRRFGFSYIPMDEALARCVLDLSGRTYHVINLNCQRERVEDCQVEDITHFFISLAKSAEINLHIQVLYGDNEHHKIEAAFKALAKSLQQAVEVVSEDIPSTKGIL